MPIAVINCGMSKFAFSKKANLLDENKELKITVINDTIKLSQTTIDLIATSPYKINEQE